MKRIGILSDTHSYWDDKYLHYFEPCDEIWHAGDIGSVEVAEKLAAFRPFRAVCGNCDGGDLRLMYRELNRFKCEDVDVLIKHIGTLHALCQSATTIYRWALTYLEGEIRQDVGAVAYQSWRCWFARLAQGAYPRPPRHRRSRVQGPRGDNIR